VSHSSFFQRLNMNLLRKTLTLGLYAAAAVAPLTPVSFAVAQTTGAAAGSGLESVTIIGSRRANASATP
jgi:hypothetical protein